MRSVLGVDCCGLAAAVSSPGIQDTCHMMTRVSRRGQARLPVYRIERERAKGVLYLSMPNIAESPSTCLLAWYAAADIYKYMISITNTVLPSR